MAMGTGNECFETHLIEEDGTLNRVEIDEFTKKVDLAAYELNYVVVSIMGPQSSGKSTLLNHLFGSKFEEMDRRQRRAKITKGIWLARCAGIEPCTLVMDVEGSDGRERGEDDTSFERRSGVFALAVSDIVLINMFYTSVGLEHGASKPLLNHVLQGVLRLSTSPHKTTLMFVIRDIIDTTDLETSKPILGENIRKIWDSIPKPERHKGTLLSRFFNIEFVGLPNFLERKEKFEEQVKILRQRFNHSLAPRGLAGDSKRTILGSDFSLFVQEIWKTIKEDGELDLPRQEVMLANTRCGEIANKKLEDFVANEERRQLEEGAKTNPATGFGKKYNSIINSYLHGYNKETENYDEGVRSEKREHLKEKMMLLVQSAVQSIFAHIGSRTLGEFKEAFHNALIEGENAEVASHNCKEACMKSFDDRCADVIVEQVNCNTSKERKKLQLAIDNLVLQVKLEQEKKVIDSITRCKEIVAKKLKDFNENEERRQLEEGAKTNPAPGFRKEYIKIIKSCLDGYDEETKNYDEGVRSEKREHLKEKMMLLVQSAIQSIFAQIGLRTLEEFKEAFHKALDKGETAIVASHIHKEACMKSFDVRCADVIVEQANCNTSEEREKLEDAIDFDVQDSCLRQEIKGLQKVIAFGVAGIATAVAGAAAAADAVGTGGAAALAAGLLASGSAAALAASGVRDPDAIADAITGAAALIAETIKGNNS